MNSTVYTDTELTRSMISRGLDMPCNGDIRYPSVTSIINSKAYKLVDSLRQRHLAVGIFALVSPVWILLLSTMMPLSVSLIVIYSAFCVAVGVVNLVYRHKLGQVYNFYALPVAEAQSKLLSLSTWRKNIKLVRWILAIPVVCLLFYECGLVADDSIMIGAVAGGAGGLIIGIYLELRTRRELRKLRGLFAE